MSVYTHFSQASQLRTRGATVITERNTPWSENRENLSVKCDATHSLTNSHPFFVDLRLALTYLPACVYLVKSVVLIVSLLICSQLCVHHHHPAQQPASPISTSQLVDVTQQLCSGK